MATLVGLLLVVGGIVVLIVMRPWRPLQPADQDEVAPTVDKPRPRGQRASGDTRPRPGVRPRSEPSQRRHQIEAIPRGRRLPAEPGRLDIVLPDWLGPMADHLAEDPAGTTDPRPRRPSPAVTRRPRSGTLRQAG